MRALWMATCGSVLLAVAACGGRDGGPSTTTSTANPQDPAFSLIGRTGAQGTTWFVAPTPSGAGASVDSPGAVQVGSVPGQGSASFRWTDRRALSLCAEGRTVEGPAQATVGGQVFTIAHSCAAAVTAAAAPNPSAISPFGGPVPATPAAPAAPGSGPMSPPLSGPGMAPPGYTPPAAPMQPARSSLPARRPGLWRTTVIGANGQPAGQQDICLNADRAANWTPDPEEARQCQQYQVTTDGTWVYGNAVCTTPQGPMRMQARFRGDYGSAYQGQMIVDVQGPEGPVRQQMTTQSQYVGPCDPG